MKADLSRDTFERTRHYGSVRLQQGRIITDADWNEQADITRHRAETPARDAIGPCGGPLGSAGYALTAETNALAVHAADADTVWVLAEDGALLTTADGGANWTLEDLDTAEHLRAMAIVGNVGWVVGDGGVVRRTTNAGASWSERDAGIGQSLRGVAAVDADRAWAVGDGGIVATADGGQSWRRVPVEAGRLHAVAFVDASNGLAVGQGGTILATGNGGETWNAVASGTTAHLRGLARIGSTRLWTAGHDGSILRSQDGGATWEPCSTPTADNLHAIAFRDADEGWAVGESGAVLHSLDGGATWQTEASGAAATTLRGLSVFGAEPGWAVGDRGVALRVGSGSPDIQSLLLPAVNLSIEPGRYYVNGVLSELEARCSYAHQPDGGAGERLAPGVHLMYLDVWQHHVTALSDPLIRETALGGPDTATRARIVAQVRALPLPATSPLAWSCGSSIPAWDELVGMARPRLAARAEPQLAAANLCEIAATAGYRRLENQLYRVEVHEGGANPSFKWSRENGSVAYAVVAVTTDEAANRTTIRVAARGRDGNLDLAAGDRIELADDETDLTGRAGTLLEYVEDGDDELEIVLSGLPAETFGRDLARHPVLRRWDQRPDGGANALPLVDGVWTELEDGVQVRFEPGGTYRPGDYWQIPARTITGDVEWPRDANGDPLAREPAGIADSHCRLGLVEVDAEGAVTVLGDCRELFPPLTRLEQIHYVSGDGQDAAPSAPLPQPLALRVSRGAVPIPQAGIRFEVESGGGLVGDGIGGSPVLFETTTDDHGLAECRWTLGPAASAPGRHQRVRASLLDADGDAIPGQVIVYCATASLLLQYVSGDGQEATANAALPHPLQMRAVNGGDGVPGVTLTATVAQGGGQVVGQASDETDAEGYASFIWRLGGSGPQRLTVRLSNGDGVELQRLEYTATVTPQASTGGGCDITIGPGGQFEQLDSDLLERLLKENRGMVCLCFLPGVHVIETLQAKGVEGWRLSLHGCGPTAVLLVHDAIDLSGFDALDLRDLAITFAKDRGAVLHGNREVRLRNLSLAHETPEASEMCLHVVGESRVVMSGCAIGFGRSAAALFEGLTGDCHIDRNRFEGTVCFYGPPLGDLSLRYVEALSGSPRMKLVPGSSRLHFGDNDLHVLTIGGAVGEQLLGRTAEDLFQTAVLHGNTFEGPGNVFASGLLSLAGNSFLAEPSEGQVYGAMIANRATAAGNVAVRIDDSAILHVLTPSTGGFSGAANQVFILPQP